MSEKLAGKIYRIISNSASNWPILLKFGMPMLVHYQSAEFAELLKVYAGAMWTSKVTKCVI